MRTDWFHFHATGFSIGVDSSCREQPFNNEIMRQELICVQPSSANTEWALNAPIHSSDRPGPSFRLPITRNLWAVQSVEGVQQLEFWTSLASDHGIQNGDWHSSAMDGLACVRLRQMSSTCWFIKISRFWMHRKWMHRRFEIVLNSISRESVGPKKVSIFFSKSLFSRLRFNVVVPASISLVFVEVVRSYCNSVDTSQLSDLGVCARRFQSYTISIQCSRARTSRLPSRLF